MGIAEELREKARRLRSSNDFVCKDFVAIEFGISSPCKSPRRCCDCYADMFERIADRIDAERALPEGIDAERALPEGVEWPRFEDGEPVKVGDEVEFEGETMRVHLATFDADGWALWCSHEGIDGRLSGSYGERVKRPAPKVLDADGAPIEVGDTVYLRSNWRMDEATGIPNSPRTLEARDALLDECADVVQAVCNLAASLGVRDMTDRMHACRVRNEKRGRL